MKKKLNHVRNLAYGIGASVLIAFVVAAANPVNGWVFSLITIVLVTLPLTLITVIVQNVQARNSKPAASSSAAEPGPLATESDNAAPALEPVDEDMRSKYKARGWVHLCLGIGILALAIVNLVILQSEDYWGKAATEIFWWIIALCSSVSFILANTNFAKVGDFMMRGWIDLIVGLSVLALAAHNLILAQTNPMWTAPYWWIVASFSTIFFIFASTNFDKARKSKGK